MITESPPGNGNGARESAGPGNEDNDTQQLADSTAVVNRKLIKSQRGLAFYAVLERRNRVRYEIVSQSKTWHFPLFFSADSKWDRLIRSKGEQP
jgi:hypothetical protein